MEGQEVKHPYGDIEGIRTLSNDSTVKGWTEKAAPRPERRTTKKKGRR